MRDELPETTHGLAPVTGGTLYYESTGEGPSIVFTHAGVADHTMWDEQVAAFAGQFRVVTYDMRGFGRSPNSSELYARHTDLAQLMAHLGIERAHVVGLSYGARVSLEFALEHPGRVASLVLAAAHTAAATSTPGDDLLEKAIDDACDSGDLDRANELELRLWVDGPGQTTGRAPASVRQRVSAMNRAALEAPEGEHPAESLKPPPDERLGDVRAQTLVLAGEFDVSVCVASADILAAGIPNARKVVLPTAHMINMELPARFNELLREFVGAVAALPAPTAPVQPPP